MKQLKRVKRIWLRGNKWGMGAGMADEHFRIPQDLKALIQRQAIAESLLAGHKITPGAIMITNTLKDPNLKRVDSEAYESIIKKYKFK